MFQVRGSQEIELNRPQTMPAYLEKAYGGLYQKVAITL